MDGHHLGGSYEEEMTKACQTDAENEFIGIGTIAGMLAPTLIKGAINTVGPLVGKLFGGGKK